MSLRRDQELARMEERLNRLERSYAALLDAHGRRTVHLFGGAEGLRRLVLGPQGSPEFMVARDQGEGGPIIAIGVDGVAISDIATTSYPQLIDADHVFSGDVKIIEHHWKALDRVSATVYDTPSGYQFGQLLAIARDSAFEWDYTETSTTRITLDEDARTSSTIRALAYWKAA